MIKSLVDRNEVSDHTSFSIYLVSIAIFGMKLGQFIVIPFLSIYLSHCSALTPFAIGGVIASGQLAYSLTSILTGHLVDLYTPKRMLIVTLLFDAIAYGYLHYSQTLMAFIIMNAVIGIMRAGFDNASKTILIVSVDTKQRGFVFGLRYIVLNLAAAIGPIIGSMYATLTSSNLFILIAFFYVLIAGVLFLTLPRQNPNKNCHSSSTNKPSIQLTVKLIKTNSALRILFLISFLCYSVYAQISSTLAQYLDRNFINGIAIYGNLLMLNAVACVVFQSLFKPLLKRVSLYFAASLGMFFLGCGFIGFYFAQTMPTFVLAVLLLSLGEVVFFPLNDLLLSKIAPQDLTGSYYGIIDASLIGFGIGPMIGGLIFQFGDHQWLFSSCAILSFMIILLYKKLMPHIPAL
jgi:MFS family permease